MFSDVRALLDVFVRNGSCLLNINITIKKFKLNFSIFTVTNLICLKIINIQK